MACGPGCWYPKEYAALWKAAHSAVTAPVQASDLSGTGSAGVRAVAYGMTDFQHSLLFYDMAADYLERRPGFRSKHLVAERFAGIDPYVTEGLVTSWKVREWTTVVGDGAASPVQP